MIYCLEVFDVPLPFPLPIVHTELVKAEDTLRVNRRSSRINKVLGAANFIDSFYRQCKIPQIPYYRCQLSFSLSISSKFNAIYYPFLLVAFVRS